MRELERFVILQVVDVRWREHLENMDYLREGVGLRAMAQKDPLVEYTREGERMFTDARPRDPRRGRAAPVPCGARARGGAAGARQQTQTANGNLQYEHETAAGRRGDRSRRRRRRVAPAWRLARRRSRRSPHEKIGRNDPCWCGSGKKFKKCHGA